jgi:hypothetical protein
MSEGVFKLSKQRGWHVMHPFLRVAAPFEELLYFKFAHPPRTGNNYMGSMMSRGYDSHQSLREGPPTRREPPRTHPVFDREALRAFARYLCRLILSPNT